MALKGLEATVRSRRATATRLRMTLAEYDRRLAAGEKWCTTAKEWHAGSKFSAAGRCRIHGRRTAAEKEYNDRLARLLAK